MLFIKSKVLPSKIAGLGLFAGEDVPKGAVIWKFTPGFDLKFTKQQVENFPSPIRDWLKEYYWLSKKSGKYCVASDNARYFNHSDNPNSLSAYYNDEEEVVTKAIRDIAEGEEITDDYRAFHDYASDPAPEDYYVNV